MQYRVSGWSQGCCVSITQAHQGFIPLIISNQPCPSEDDLAHHTQSHPSAPACLPFFKRAWQKTRFPWSTKVTSYSLYPSLLSSSLAAFSAVIFPNCLLSPFTEKWWTVLSNLFFLKVMGMQSLTADWIHKATSAIGAIAFPLLPKLNIQGIWTILPIIRLLTKAILMYSEANSR